MLILRGVRGGELAREFLALFAAAGVIAPFKGVGQFVLLARFALREGVAHLRGVGSTGPWQAVGGIAFFRLRKAALPGAFGTGVGCVGIVRVAGIVCHLGRLLLRL